MTKISPKTSFGTKLPTESEGVSASTPSEEFPYSWFNLSGHLEAGLFFRTPEEAYVDARSNFQDFTIDCSVIIVKAMSGINATLEDN